MSKKEGNGGSFSGWLQRVRRTGEFSDVTVLVDGQEFRLHMLPLLNGSTYFRNLSDTTTTTTTTSTTVIPSSSSSSFSLATWSWSPASKRLDLPGLVGGASAFAAAADFCYLIKPSYTIHNVALIRAVAEQLGMAELLESTKKYLYMNIFSHWRTSAAFLAHHGSPILPAVDAYVEPRCVKVIVAACTKAFLETRYLSAPIPFSGSNNSNNNVASATPISSSASSSSWQSSPCQNLANVLASVASLPDRYVTLIVDEIVSAEVNLNLKCRQGRNVKGWLDALVTSECKSDNARCWVVVWLSRMLEKSVTQDRPWLELSSQYWCTLLEHAGSLLDSKLLASDINTIHMRERLRAVTDFLEYRIGSSLHELDDYLHTYKLGRRAFLSLAQHFKPVAGSLTEKEVEEVVVEVDSCLWDLVESGPLLPAQDFISLIEAFPQAARKSHDLLYAAVEKLTGKSKLTETGNADEMNEIWKLVELPKLSPIYSEKAMNNPAYLSQPHVLEYVLQQHSEELGRIGDEDKQNLRQIMQRVIRASLKLLEENSRRSKEIMELQKQYAHLVGVKATSCLHHDNSCESSPDIMLRLPPSLNRHTKFIMPSSQEEVDEAPSDTPGSV